MAFLFGGSNKAASDAAASQNQNAAFMMQMQQQQAQQLQAQQALLQTSSNQATKQASQTIGNPNAYAGLVASTENAKLFDTTTTKTGRYALLGN